MRTTKEQIKRDEQIYQLGTLVAGKFSLQEVLDKLTEAAVKIVRVKACSIRLLDEEAGDLKMRSTYGLSEEYRNKGEVSKNDTVIKAAFAGEAVVLDDNYSRTEIVSVVASGVTIADLTIKRAGTHILLGPPMRFTKENIAQFGF